MTTSEHYKKNFNLAYPVILGSLGHITVGVADSVMVGQLGPFPLAAVSLGNSLFAVPFVFGMGLSYGITPLVANADGANDQNTLHRVLKNGIFLCLVAGVLMALLAMSFKFIAPSLDQDPVVTDLTLPYLSLIGASIVPLMLFFALKQFCEGLSDTKIGMRVSIGANLLNILLNYLLIFGKWGFPELGLVGAGLATLVSRVVMMIFMFIYVWKAKRFSTYTKAFFTTPITVNGQKEIWNLGAPSGLQYIFEVSAFAGASILAGQIGPFEQAAHQIAINLASVSYMMVSGLGVAATIRVGNQLGQKDYLNLSKAANSLFILTLIFMVITGITFLFGRHFFPGLYTNEIEVIQIAATLLIIAVLFQISDGIQVTAMGALRGLSDVKMPTLITFISYWIIAIPLALFFSKVLDWGIEGIWIALATGLTISAVLLFIRFRKKAQHLLKFSESVA